MLDLGEKRKLDVKFEGKIYELTYPSVQMGLEYDEKYKKQEKSDTEIMIEFVEELGLPREVAIQLEDFQFVKLVQELRKAPK